MLPLETADDVGEDGDVAMELEVLGGTALMQIWVSGEFNPRRMGSLQSAKEASEAEPTDDAVMVGDGLF